MTTQSHAYIFNISNHIPNNDKNYQYSGGVLGWVVIHIRALLYKLSTHTSKT